jgi:hypothetical protein
MAATHEVLLERVKHRRIDPTRASEPFHCPPEPPKGAPPPATPPLLPRDGKGAVDAARLATLKPRHDDSQENVRERLRLWDLHNADVHSARRMFFALAGVSRLQ